MISYTARSMLPKGRNKAIGKHEDIRQVWGEVEKPVHDQSKIWTDNVEPQPKQKNRKQGILKLINHSN